MPSSRGDIARNGWSRVVAAVWSLVILLIFLPLAIILWIAWMVISIPGSILFDTNLFRWSGGAPGFSFASETFSWFQANLDHALFGAGGGIQWRAGYSPDRWEAGR